MTNHSDSQVFVPGNVLLAVDRQIKSEDHFMGQLIEHFQSMFFCLFVFCLFCFKYRHGLQSDANCLAVTDLESNVLC